MKVKSIQVVTLLWVGMLGPAMVVQAQPEAAPVLQEAAPIELKFRDLPGFCVTKPFQAVIRNQAEWDRALLASGAWGEGHAEKPLVPEGVDFTQDVVAFVALPEPIDSVSINVKSAYYQKGKIRLAIQKQALHKEMRKTDAKAMALVAIARPNVDVAFVEAPVVTQIMFKDLVRGIASSMIVPEKMIITDKKSFTAFYSGYQRIPKGGKVNLPDIDFSRQSFIAVRSGMIEDQAGVITIKRIEHSGNQYTIFVEVTHPRNSGAPSIRQRKYMMQPYHFVVAEVPMLKAVFQFRERLDGDPEPRQPAMLSLRWLNQFPSVKPIQQVIHSKAEWNPLLAGFGPVPKDGHKKSKIGAPPMPTVDFTQEVLAVCSLPPDGTLFSTVIHSATRFEVKVTLQYKKWRMAQRCPVRGHPKKPLVPQVAVVAVQRPPIQLEVLDISLTK